jgi:HK97 family phage major capsid protein
VSTYLERLFEEYRRAAKIGSDEMESWTGEPTDEQRSKRDAAFEDVERLKGEIDKVQGFEKLRVAGDAFREVAVPVIERATGKAPTEAELFRTMLKQGGVYESRTTKHLNDHIAPELALRALQSAGGSAVETSFADFVTVFERTLTPMLRPDVVTVLNRADGSPLVLPRVTADPNHGGTVTAEATGVNELDPTISSVQLNPYKYAITNLWSAELSADNTIGLEELLAFTTARELGIDIGAHLTTGNDTGQPNGFITAGANGGTAAGTGATFGTYFGGTDLIDLYYSRAAPYRESPGAAWQANATSLAQIRKSRDTTGQLLWQPSYILGQPESLLGKPIYENPAMANGSAAKAVAFGDFKRYIVARVNPIRVESSIHYKFNTDQLALRTIERVDGDLPDAIAIAYLVNAAV